MHGLENWWPGACKSAICSKSAHSIKLAWSLLGITHRETYLDGVLASVYEFPSAEHFAKGCQLERIFFDAHAKIEAFSLWAALPGAKHLERCFAT